MRAAHVWRRRHPRRNVIWPFPCQASMGFAAHLHSRIHGVLCRRNSRPAAARTRAFQVHRKLGKPSRVLSSATKREYSPGCGQALAVDAPAGGRDTSSHDRIPGCPRRHSTTRRRAIYLGSGRRADNARVARHHRGLPAIFPYVLFAHSLQLRVLTCGTDELTS